jgi:hypothetical protein
MSFVETGGEFRSLFVKQAEHSKRSSSRSILICWIDHSSKARNISMILPCKIPWQGSLGMTDWSWCISPGRHSFWRKQTIWCSKSALMRLFPACSLASPRDLFWLPMKVVGATEHFQWSCLHWSEWFESWQLSGVCTDISHWSMNGCEQWWGISMRF